LARSQVLDGELAAAAEEEGEEPKQVEQESDHQAEIAREISAASTLVRRPGLANNRAESELKKIHEA
jgi:hypothetical protein